MALAMPVTAIMDEEEEKLLVAQALMDLLLPEPPTGPSESRTVHSETDLELCKQPANMPPLARLSWMRLPDWVTKAGENYPLWQPFTDVSLVEAMFGSAIKIKPEKYREVRVELFELYHQVVCFDERGCAIEASLKRWTKTRAQKIGGCDVNAISKVFAWYDINHLWKQDWRTAAHASPSG